MSRSVAALVLVVAGILTLRLNGHAQDGVSPDAARILEGVVTAESAETPLRRVRLTVTWTGGETDPVFTDDSGRFSVAIPAGVYHTLTATKPGYAPVRIGREPDSSGAPVAVRMPKGAVITGSVIDAAGAAVPGATVRIRRTDPSGRTYETGDYQTDTDDRGEFRVGSLPSGRYAVVLASAGTRPALGEAVQADSVVDVPAGGERAVLRIDPRVMAGSGSAASYAAGFNAGSRTVAGALVSGVGSLGAVQGRVLDELGRPLPAVLVRAFAITGGTGPVGASDPDGRYQISNLAAGTYRLVASRSLAASLVAQSATGNVVMSSSLRIPDDGPGQIVVIGAGERLTGMDLTLRRGGVITGQVVDAAGEPLEGITVQAWTRRRVAGRTLIEPALVGSSSGSRGRRTDDRGQFRLFDLQPGSYYLSAAETPPESTVETATARLVFHPSAVSPAMATPLTVHEGTEAFASITFASGPLSTVEGQAFDESGEPFQGSIRLVARVRDGALAAAPREMLVRDGTFRFADVPPGDYAVQAIARIISGVRLAAIGESGLRFGVAFVSAPPGAASSSVVRAGTGSVLQGRVVVDGTPGQPPPMPITVSAEATDPDLSPAGELRRARVQSDGSFEISGLFGPMRLSAELPPGWRLESIYVDGTNAADEPVTFGTAQESRTGIDVMLARGGAEIAGQIAGDAALRAGALVVAGPGDPARWHERSRLVKMTTADRDGRFTLGGLPAGVFVVAAIDPRTLRPGGGERLSPDDVRLVVSDATPVSVTSDGRVSVEVRLTRLPE